MLIIRREQMEVFRRAAIRRFERDTLAELRAALPEPFARRGEAGVRQLLRDAGQRCAGLGISVERDVAHVAELDLRFGAPFERQAGLTWAGPILRDTTIVPGARLALIQARLSTAIVPVAP